MKTFLHLWQYLAEFFLEWEMFQVKVVEKIKTHIFIFSNFFFFRKSRRLWGSVWKYGRVRQAAPENKMLGREDALCMKVTAAKIQTHS